MAAAALAASQRQRVVYVDTSNALRAARLQGVVEAQAAAEGAQQVCVVVHAFWGGRPGDLAGRFQL